MSFNMLAPVVKTTTKKIVKHIKDEEAKAEAKKQAVIKAKNDYAQNYRAEPRTQIRGGYPDATSQLRDVNEHKWKGVIR